MQFYVLLLQKQQQQQQHYTPTKKQKRKKIPEITTDLSVYIRTVIRLLEVDEKLFNCDTDLLKDDPQQF